MTTTVLDGFTLCLPFFESGQSNCAEISRQTGVHSRTVRRYFKAYQTKKPVDTVGRDGRPPKVDHPGKIRIAQIVRHNPVISSNEISHKIESSTGNLVSPRTIRRTLSGMRYDRRKPRNVPMLTKRHIEARMKFAQENLDRDWTKVLFSDESFVQLFSNSLTMWTRKGTTRENPQVKDRTKVMFWGAFGLNMRSELRFIEGNMTGEVYRGILAEHVVPLLTELNRSASRRKKGIVFQQNNDPKHTCKLVREYIKETGLEVLEWPSCSPDLNPIENLWSIIKGKVYKKFPKTKNELKALLIQKWERMDSITIANLVNLMKIRCLEVIKNNEKRIDY